METAAALPGAQADRVHFVRTAPDVAVPWRAWVPAGPTMLILVLAMALVLVYQTLYGLGVALPSQRTTVFVVVGLALGAGVLVRRWLRGGPRRARRGRAEEVAPTPPAGARVVCVLPHGREDFARGVEAAFFEPAAFAIGHATAPRRAGLLAWWGVVVAAAVVTGLVVGADGFPLLVALWSAGVVAATALVAAVFPTTAEVTPGRLELRRHAPWGDERVEVFDLAACRVRVDLRERTVRVGAPDGGGVEIDATLVPRRIELFGAVLCAAVTPRAGVPTG